MPCRAMDGVASTALHPSAATLRFALLFQVYNLEPNGHSSLQLLPRAIGAYWLSQVTDLR